MTHDQTIPIVPDGDLPIFIHNHLRSLNLRAHMDGNVEWSVIGPTSGEVVCDATTCREWLEPRGELTIVLSDQCGNLIRTPLTYCVTHYWEQHGDDRAYAKVRWELDVEAMDCVTDFVAGVRRERETGYLVRVGDEA